MRISSTFIHGLLVSFIFLGIIGCIGLQFSLPEVGFVLLCLGLQEFHLRLLTSRSLFEKISFWFIFFCLTPLFYLFIRFESLGFSLFKIPLASRPFFFLSFILIAIATPLQSFAAYFPSRKHSQYIISVFVLIEIFIGIKNGTFLDFFMSPLLFITCSLLLMGLSVPLVLANHQQNTKRNFQHEGCQKPILLSTQLLLLFLCFSLITITLGFAFFTLFPRPSLPLLFSQILNDDEQKKPSSPSEFSRERNKPSLHAEEPKPPFPESDSSNKGILRSEVKLGNFGTLLKDPTPFARFYLDSPSSDALPSRVFLKTASLDRFENQTWQPLLSQANLLQAEARTGKKIFLLQKRLTAEPSQTLDFKVDFSTPQPLHSGISLPLPPLSLSLEDLRFSHENQLQNKDIKVRYDTFHKTLRAQSTVSDLSLSSYSGSFTLDSEQLPRTLLRPFMLKELTALPAHFETRLKAAWQIPESLAPFTTDPLLFPEELEAWMKTSGAFRYSLEQHPQGTSSLIDFLCTPNQRIGHCEYFAAGMVVLLRMYNIPARLCIGYALDLTPLTSFPEGSREKPFWIIRHQDAHAWVEVYHQEQGWKIYDPTSYENSPEISSHPFPEEEGSQKAETLDPKQKTKNLIKKEPSRDPFLYFSHESRSDLVQNVQTFFSFQNPLLHSFKEKKKSTSLISLLLLAFLLFGAVLTIRKYRLKPGTTTNNSQKGVSASSPQERKPPTLYNKLFFLLQKYGFSHRPSQTPRELSRNLMHESGPQLEPLKETVELLYRLRFRNCSTQRRNVEETPEKLEKEILERYKVLEACFRKIQKQKEL